jgi:hypothetical protein
MSVILNSLIVPEVRKVVSLVNTMKAYKGRRNIAPLILNLCSRRR